MTQILCQSNPIKTILFCQKDQVSLLSCSSVKSCEINEIPSLELISTVPLMLITFKINILTRFFTRLGGGTAVFLARFDSNNLLQVTLHKDDLFMFYP